MSFGDLAGVPGLVAKWIHSTGNSQDPEVTPEYLTDAISEVTVETQTLGSALLQVTLIDPAWKIARSGICDTDEDGLLGLVDVQFPEGTDVWWRLAMVDISNDLSDPNLTLTFQQRIVSYLSMCWGALAVTPGTMTRAQFIKQMVDKMPKELPKKLVGPGGLPKITFICPELNEVQPIATSNSSNSVVIPGTQAANTQANVNRTGGLSSGSGLTAAGQPLSATQTSIANRLLAVCRQLNAGQVATEAMIYAAIYESGLGANPSTNSLGYTGVLQGNVRYGFSPASVEDEARSFLQGGKGYNSAITLARRISNPIEVAVKCEVPSIWPDNAYAHESGYRGDAAALAEVQRIVQAGGGGGLGGGTGAIGTPTTSDVSQLTRGTSENSDEDSWTCMQRLASEVNWSLFTSPSPSTGVYGNYLYYIDGPTLVAQKPRLTISLSDDGTTWAAKDPDTGKIVDGAGDSMITQLHSTVDNTAMRFQQTRKVKGKTQRKTRIRTPQTPSQIRFSMISGTMEFNAGDVFVIQNAGPLSTGNGGGAGNGRWIVEDVTDNTINDIFGQFTLGPPTYPYPEPAANTSTVLGPNGQPVLISQGGNSAGTPGGGAGSGKPTGSYKGLSSPFTHWMGDITLRYVDQGVDFGMGYSNIHVGDEILAIGDCYCRSSTEFYVGSSNPQARWFEFTQPLKASTGYWGWYIAEEFNPKVNPSSQLLPAGTIVGTYAASGTGIEIGWAAGPGLTWCKAHFPGEVASRHAGSGTTPGRDFLHFLQQTGAAGANPKHNAAPGVKPFVAILDPQDQNIPVQPGGIFQSIFDRDS